MTDVASSVKNFGLSPASEDLGLGDQLTQQLADQVAQMKKRTQIPGAAAGSGTAGLATGNAVMDLLGIPSLGGYGGGQL